MYITLFTGPPSPPSHVTFTMYDFQTKHYSVILTWEGQNADHYSISVNTSTHTVNTSMTSLVLEGQYNIPLQVTLIAINCAGNSDEVTEDINIGIMQVYSACDHYYCT